MADKITRSTRHPVYDMEYEREYCTSLVQHANLSFTDKNYAAWSGDRTSTYNIVILKVELVEVTLW